MSDIEERLEAIERALLVLKPMTKSNDDVQVVVDLVDKERQRRVVDKWFQDRTKAFLGTGKWVLAVIAMILAFKDQMAGLIEHVIEYIRFTRGE